MTLSEQEVAGIGELTRTARRIEDKVDKLDEKLDDKTVLLAEHDMRIGVLEKAAQRGWERFTLWVMATVALVAAAIQGIASAVH